MNEKQNDAGDVHDQKVENDEPTNDTKNVLQKKELNQIVINHVTEAIKALKKKSNKKARNGYFEKIC